jgi:hypothetical protein
MVLASVDDPGATGLPHGVAMAKTVRVGEVVRVELMHVVQRDGQHHGAIRGRVEAVDEAIRLDSGENGLHVLPWNVIAFVQVIESAEEERPRRGYGTAGV